jgi:hypothetical protein
MSPFDCALARIDEAGISAPIYRTARRLLDLAADSGYIEISHDQALHICETDAWGTVRRHLIALEKVGVIKKWLNHSSRVWFVGYPPPNWIEEVFMPRAEVFTPRADARELRTPDEDDVSRSAQNRALSDQNRALSDQNRALSDQNRALSDQIDPPAYTHAGAHVVVVDPDPSNEEEGITTTTTTTTNPPNPTEQALSVALLAHVGLKPMAATKRLAAEHPFGRIRDCVAYWWPQRKCVGGRFEDAPLIVLHWLDHWDTAMIPPMPPEFRRTDLYHDHCRTPAERKAEAEAEAELAQLDHAADIPRPVIERALPLTPQQALWKQLTTDYAQLRDATLTVDGDRWIITTIMADWCNVQIKQRVERDLKWAGVTATVEFTMEGQVTP